jgi:hypothetical protein
MRLAVFAAAVSLWACTTGQGQGEVTSEQLNVRDCWNGPFSLQPTFFGANPNRSETLFIRVQRGDDTVEVSDGLTITVRDPDAVRERTGESVPVGLPEGVDLAATTVASAAPPPLVSMALYLHASCNRQNGVLYSVDGSITFDSLFSGDPNESEGSERLTEAHFEADFADPRLLSTAEATSDVLSRVTGWFRFFFQRGPPAQPFP